MPSRTLPEVLAATRLLGGIAEDGFARRETVLPHILYILTLAHPAVRTAAAEAIWQIGDRSVIDALRSALERETHPHTRLTMEHVLRVLG
ncbi:MAG: HEAT repeat domain-containing protein [Nannocystis sp.]|nr:HEAT repeat domain-containing protein [Nannocystis sp.]